MNHFLLLFIDGVGIGPENRFNPFCTVDLPGFLLLSGGNGFVNTSKAIQEPGHTYTPIDACLDVAGLPQSGTGQASLFTGVNCAGLAGRHYGPFPHSTSLPVIAKDNIFKRLDAVQKSCVFANAYPPIFFDHAKKRNRWSVTTRSCLDAGLRIRDLNDLANGQALAADISGQRLVDHLKLDVNVLQEEEAARNLVALSADHTFTAFEYFLTDKAGHAQSQTDAERWLRSLDRFILQLVHESEASGVTLLITSDHGNVEDLSTKTHTRNPVPFVAYGPTAPRFRNVKSLTDIVPEIVAASTV